MLCIITETNLENVLLVSGGYGVGQNLYHLEWCPKYRYKMFMKGENKKLCEKILREVAERHKIKITELSVMPDHIHISQLEHIGFFWNCFLSCSFLIDNNCLLFQISFIDFSFRLSKT